MLKPKKDYSAVFNEVAMAKAHEMLGAPNSPRKVVDLAKKDARFGLGRVVEFLSDIRDGVREYTQSRRDTPFDVTALMISPESSIHAYPLNLYTHQLGASERLIIQNFCFFIIVDDEPIHLLTRNVLADPLEFFQNIRFELLENDRPIGFSLMRRAIPAIVNYNFDGFSALTQDPANFDPAQCVRYESKPGTRFTVRAQEIVPVVAAPAQRQPYYHGCRIRGFTRPLT